MLKVAKWTFKIFLIITELGAVFTFGKSKFSDNLPGTFWVKNDVVISVACGDQHSVFITASGRAFSFGSNDYGQLGQSHTKPLVNPRCIKGMNIGRLLLYNIVIALVLIPISFVMQLINTSTIPCCVELCDCSEP